MPHVSKNKVSVKVMTKIKKNLVRIIIKPYKDRTIAEELFTETEYIMLAKRLATIVLILKGISNYKIAKNLKVSKSTVSRLAKDINLGKYESIKDLVTSKKKSDIQVLDILEKVLLMGMPSYSGKGRWDFLNDLDKS